MSDQKSQVLAKCEEIAPQKDTNYGFEKFNIERVNLKTTLYTDWGFVSFSLNTPDASDAWEFAASILKVGRFSIPQKVWEDNIKEGLEDARQMGYDQGKAEAIARPSDAVLFECWKSAIAWWDDRGQPRIGCLGFDEWLATLPADPLKADRETIKNAIENGIECRTGMRISDEAIEAIKRVLGLGVEP